MEIVKIEKVNLVDAVYQQLREMIVTGKLAEGVKLDSENKLAQSFNVSRVVIREALQQLRSEKLIVTRQGVGTYVANPSNFLFGTQTINLTEEAYRDFLRFRESVEYSAVTLSKTAAVEADFDELDRCVEVMKQTQFDRQEFNEADFNFHFAVVRCSHNLYLENAMKSNRQPLISVFDAMNARRRRETLAWPPMRIWLRSCASAMSRASSEAMTRWESTTLPAWQISLRTGNDPGFPAQVGVVVLRAPL